jgi:hypothetical protein
MNIIEKHFDTCLEFEDGMPIVFEQDAGRGGFARPLSPHPYPFPEERENHLPPQRSTRRAGFRASRTPSLPLLKGEGRGEGKGSEPISNRASSLKEIAEPSIAGGKL